MLNDIIKQWKPVKEVKIENIAGHKNLQGYARPKKLSCGEEVPLKATKIFHMINNDYREARSLGISTTLLTRYLET